MERYLFIFFLVGRYPCVDDGLLRWAPGKTTLDPEASGFFHLGVFFPHSFCRWDSQLPGNYPIVQPVNFTGTVTPTVSFSLSTAHCFLSSPPQMILPSFLFFSAGIGCSSWPFSCPQTCLRKRRNRIWAVTSSALKLQRNISFSHELPQIFPCTLIGILIEVWRCLLCEMLALLPSVIRTDYKYLWFEL